MSSVSSESSDIGKPQELINEFWENLITKKPTKVTKIFPPRLYANLLPSLRKRGITTGKNAAESYEAAATECRARIKRIVRECHRINEKFTDPEFDIESESSNCLKGLQIKDVSSSASGPAVDASQLGDAISTLVQSDMLIQNSVAIDLDSATRVLNPGGESSSGPENVHRIDWIFENPSFELDGFSSSDLCQGANGDCWFIAAVATICSQPELMSKVCVSRDEECGVYGFVFFRDGDWIWTVVDDNLYLRCKDFDAWGDNYDPTGEKEKKYKKSHQTGSEALYFASCADPNETWLPLLEKAYAKVHGDYEAIAGGFSGEAVEDLTGGVTSKILTDRILSKNRLWKELLLVNKEFLFSASSPSSYGNDSNARRGLALGHAYSVIKAIDAEGEDGKVHQLVLIRNPWGKRANASMGEWTGPWSDGSSEWTPYWMTKLGHKFGDDGLFWMSFEDLLKRFDLLDRTRLFDAEWTIVQRWTSVSVGWVTGFLNTKFVVQVKKSGPIVFVLCQLDDRYFRGLEGKYTFDLHFILQEPNTEPGDHIVRARGPWFGNRTVSAEVDLEAGTYEVIPKIEASRDSNATDVQDIVKKVADSNPQKLRQIGLNYDIANAKGIVELTEEEQKTKDQKKKEGKEKKEKEKDYEEKEKADFEAWKKEEKEEWEAWKKEKKAKEQKDKPKEDTKKDDAPAATSATNDTKAVTPEASTSAASTNVAKPTVVLDLTIQPKDPQTKDANTTSATEERSIEPKITIDEPSGAKEGYQSPDPNLVREGAGPAPPRTVASGYGGVGTESVYGDAGAAPPAPGPGPGPAAAPPVDDTPKPWNAVCVLGLRVYSKDPEVSIKLDKPKDPEEATLLEIDGSAAGATI